MNKNARHEDGLFNLKTRGSEALQYQIIKIATRYLFSNSPPLRPMQTTPEQPKKIGIDCRMYSSKFTGIGRYVHELTENLFRLDTKNHYILFFNHPEYEKFTPPNPRIQKRLANAHHYSLKEQLNFLHILKKEHLDLMHFTHFNAPVLYNRPSIVTIHDLTLSFYPGKKMNTPLHRFAYQKTIKNAVEKAKKIIAVSNNTKKDLQILLKTPAQKIHTIYEGVNPNFHQIQDQNLITQILQKYNINAPYLLYTGVWRSHKNLPNLIKAFHLLKTIYQFDGKLVITGDKNPVYANEIFHLTAQLNLTADIIFTGMVADQDLVPLYNGTRCYVFPSFYEGFGLPPLEAMQCGIPVASSNTSCLPEICGEKNAVYFDPNSPEDMAENINNILISSNLRAELSKNGLEHVKKFSWEKMAQETLNLYHQILN